VDPHVVAVANRVLDREEHRLAAATAGAGMACYDVISGVSGIGRYLLAGGPCPVLERVLRYLVALTEPVTVDGHRVPGWWTADPAVLRTPQDHLRGHLNIGMAHGIAGPLALLALAWTHGVRVPGQDEAIARITTWLLDRRGTDRHGPYWPALVPLEHELNSTVDNLPPSRVAWCYGAPGVARAVQLAATALGRPSWAEQAVGTLQAALRRPWPELGIKEASLCHGSAGVLSAVGLVALDSGDAELAAALPVLADHLLSQREGLTVRTHPEGRLGLLDGLAGSLLALHDHLSPADSGLPWPAAFVLA
jgi:hypothetical protein